MQPYVRRQLSENVCFTSVTDPKFKRNRLSVRLLTPHGSEYTAANAALPYLLRKGCERYPDFTLLNQRLCELYDAVLGTDIGISGASQTVLLSLATLDDRFALDGDRVVEACADLLCDVLFHPYMPNGTFPEKDFRIEQAQMLDAIDAEMNDKRRYAHLRYARTLYEGELSSLPRYGSRDAIAALCPEDLTAAYRLLLDTAAVEILFIGSGDPEPAFRRFETAFTPSSERTPMVRPAVYQSRGERELTERMPMTQTKLVMGYSSGIGRESPLADAARVMSVLLGGATPSMLFREVREKLSLCYYCGCSFDRLRGVLTVDSGIEQKNRESAVEAIQTQIRRLQSCDIPEDLLVATRMCLTDSYRGVGDSLSSVESYTLSQILYQVYKTPEEKLAELLAVTPEQIAQAASCLKPELIYCLSGNGENDDEKGEDDGCEDM